MTDIILSSLINLFALFGKEEDVDRERAKVLLANSMRRHYGIRNCEPYLEMYDTLFDLYSSDDTIKEEQIIEDVLAGLRGKIHRSEQTMMLLRLMEFCTDPADVASHAHDTTPADDLIGKVGKSDRLFYLVADKVGVDEEMYSDFCNFVTGRQGGNVLVFPIEGLNGELRTLNIPQLNFLVFTYTGTDELLLNDVPVLPGCFQMLQQSGVLKSHKSRPIYHSTIRSRYDAMEKGEHSTVQTVEFCGRNINFRFPDSDNGMHDFSFDLCSGELLAVMGGSGTGKTTLLSLLNGTMRPQSGSITINGHDITEPEAKSLIGFVPQDDLLIEELTVYQNLYYTARLCFEGMSDEEIEQRVEKTLKDFGLYAAKHLKVGSAIEKYISGGQRKRLNIALEFIREPAVLFLDEPTSGLSSADTEKVVNLLKEQTYKGKLIIVNIHQPSSDVYKLFDRLWLLDRGGYPVYDGNPIDAITYFKEAAGYADSETSTCPMCGNVNPEVVLNIIDEKALNDMGQLTDNRKMTPQEWHALYLDWRGEMPAPEVSPVPRSDQKKPNALKQFWIFLQRNAHTKVTNLQYLAIALLEAPLLALVCAFLTRFAPPEGYTLMDNKNLVSYFFMSVIVATFIGMSGSAEEIIKDRALLKREKFLQLSYSSYISSKIAYLAVVSLIQTLLFILVGNSIMGITGMFGTWWIVLFSVSLLANLTGLLLSQSLRSVVAIYISIPMLLIPQILLCGLVVSFSDLTPNSTTGNVPLIGNIIPSRWAYEALAVTSFTDNAYEAPIYELEKEKYETQFYRIGYIYELRSQLATQRDEQQKGKPIKPEHMDIVRKNLPVITDICGMKPFAGDLTAATLSPSLDEALTAYLDEADRILAQRGNRATLAADRQMVSFIHSYPTIDEGREALLALKKANKNLRLEDFVVGADQKRIINIVDGYIVPNAGFVYLTPRNHCGSTPFYASDKILAGWHIKTLWFNLAILYIMCMLAAALLYSKIINNKS